MTSCSTLTGSSNAGAMLLRVALSSSSEATLGPRSVPQRSHTCDDIGRLFRHSGDSSGYSGSAVVALPQSLAEVGATPQTTEASQQERQKSALSSKAEERPGHPCTHLGKVLGSPEIPYLIRVADADHYLPHLHPKPHLAHQRLSQLQQLKVVLLLHCQQECLHTQILHRSTGQ